MCCVDLLQVPLIASVVATSAADMSRESVFLASMQTNGHHIPISDENSPAQDYLSSFPSWNLSQDQKHISCTCGNSSCYVTYRETADGVMTTVGSHFAIASLQSVNVLSGEMFVQSITMQHAGKTALIFPYAVISFLVSKSCTTR